MARRDHSLTQYFQRVAEARTPKLTFRGASYADWQEWRAQFEPKVRELCGEWPRPVPLEAEDEEVESMTPEERERFLTELEERMREAARQFEFEKAAALRDRLKALKAREVTTVAEGE